MCGDVARCRAETLAPAVMSAEGVLYNPYLFEETHPVSWRVAKEYLQYAEVYESEASAMRAHVFRICHYRSSGLINGSCFE